MEVEMKKYTIIFVFTLILLLVTVTAALAISNGQPDGDAHPYVGR
jgi:hypothetical protein